MSNPANPAGDPRIETFRLPERAEVVAASGALRQRAARPTAVDPRFSRFLADDAYDMLHDGTEVALLGDVRLSRSATGGLSLRSGRLREVLAEAETDTLVKLRVEKGNR